VRRLPLILASCVLSLALVSGAAHAGPKKGKKGPAKSSAPKDRDRDSGSGGKAGDPLGDLGSGGVRSSSGAAAAASSGGGGGAPPQRGPTRIDFDDRLIQGQTNKSGAVYLYDRKELQTKSMVKRRESFRQEILSTVYDTQ
jgi:hypothetical protein